MRKSWKILGLVVLLVVVAGLGAGLYLWRGVRQVPDFYLVARLTGEERNRAMESVERKVLNLQSDLDAAYARTYGKGQSGDTTTQTALPKQVAVAFTGPELDTYFDKWLTGGGYREGFEQYMSNPRVFVHDELLILAGEMRDFDAVVSLRFLPEMSEDGEAVLSLDGVYAGRVPLPASAFDGLRKRAMGAIGEKVDGFRQDAAIGEDGVANEAAIMLTTQLQLARLLQGDSVSELVIFPEILGRGRVPARVSSLEVADGALNLGVELLDKTERAELLADLRAGRTPGANPVKPGLAASK